MPDVGKLLIIVGGFIVIVGLFLALVARRRLIVDHRERGVEIAALGRKPRMRLQVDAKVEVTGFRGALTLALDPNTGALGDAGRDLDLDLAPRRPNPGAAAGGAGDALHDGAIADLAPLRHKTRAAPGGTGLGHLGLNRPFATPRGLLQGDLDGMFDVLTTLARGSPTPRSLEPEARETAGLAPEVGIEEVAEIAEARGWAGRL